MTRLGDLLDFYRHLAIFSGHTAHFTSCVLERFWVKSSSWSFGSGLKLKKTFADICRPKCLHKSFIFFAMGVVLALLVWWLHLTTEICGSNPVTGHFYLVSNVIKIKKKRPRVAHFLKMMFIFSTFFCLLAKKHFENLEKNFSTIKYSSLRPARGVVCKSLRGILVSMAA